MALLGAGDGAHAEAWVARCAERALAPTTRGAGTTSSRARSALPLMRGLIALERGDADGAAETIYPMRGSAQRFGGSHAQRDLIEQTLLAAAARGRRRALGRALLNERCLAKPLTPLTRFWAQRLGVPLA